MNIVVYCWINIVVNYGISESSNEYCGTLSNGFVLNYRMDVAVNYRTNNLIIKMVRWWFVNKKNIYYPEWLTELRFSLQMFVNFHKNKEVILPFFSDQNLKAKLLSIR